MKQHKYTNDLINESSPYLLQHAHNPVNWRPWKPETLEEAIKENKLLIISVGYAACHWCHVMEHESFEDTTVAKIMNDNFICIKIDREERPDVDQVYMTAVQLMTGRGGWPMNVIALPDGRPVWGGTYFPKERWIAALKQLSEMWDKEPEKLIDYAAGLTSKVKQADIVQLNNDEINFTTYFLRQSIEKWERNFDNRYGGTKQAPKFPLPNNYEFLLRYSIQSGDNDIRKFVELTLDKMAYGGIYDHIGGGFARYSTDEKWHIPHFEKMLYDNGQLVSLYSNAYSLTKKELYKEVVYETLEFVKRELTGDNGIFYSSLDADSDNKHGHLEEGAYYVWTIDELKSILGGDFELFKEYYNINNYGKWENGNFVLIRDMSDEE
ncbi:MAG TPA: thioredoxin domain-containing protein, partial [Bacteroidetes bacterium]|nr:thioredoxin domain-containing protein [Bacteroidota bacterium]